MDPTLNHLLKLQSYFSRHHFDKESSHLIRYELLTSCLSFPDFDKSVMKREKMCLRCFTFWSEGKFTLKSKSGKGDNKLRNLSKKRMILKCDVCSKHTTFRKTSLDNSFSLCKKIETQEKKQMKMTIKKNKDKLKKRDNQRKIFGKKPLKGSHSKLKSTNKKTSLCLLNQLL